VKRDYADRPLQTVAAHITIIWVYFTTAILPFVIAISTSVFRTLRNSYNKVLAEKGKKEIEKEIQMQQQQQQAQSTSSSARSNIQTQGQAQGPARP